MGVGGTKRKTITFLLIYPEVDENSCQECGVNYDDDDYQEAWIGCDNEDCGRWVHYWCAGFDRKPSSRQKFIYSYS